MTDQSGAVMGGLIMREYRKGNWTLQETMILIEAKKMDDERRLKRSAATTSTEQQQQLTLPSSQDQEMLLMRNKPGELRWKWVEDYCWRRGCFRSQNQCNDKWDNLMRDYKKVRDYERKVTADGNGSYWSMEKSERKERGLPSNMLPTIYEALVQVVEKKSAAAAAAATTTNTDAMNLLPPTIMQPTAALSLLHQQHLNASAAAAAALPLPLLPHQPLPQSAQPISMYQAAATTIDSDTSSDSPAKRRRKDKGPETGPSSSTHEPAAVANAISTISEAIQASDDRREQRHREMLGLTQRRLQIEESRMEVNRQGMSGLVEAINNLANSILALAASNNNNSGQTPPPPPPAP